MFKQLEKKIRIKYFFTCVHACDIVTKIEIGR